MPKILIAIPNTKTLKVEVELETDESAFGVDISQPEQKIWALSEDLRITNGRLQDLDKEMVH